jgi:hypothetical protein
MGLVCANASEAAVHVKQRSLLAESDLFAELLAVEEGRATSSTGSTQREGAEEGASKGKIK